MADIVVDCMEREVNGKKTSFMLLSLVSLNAATVLDSAAAVPQP